MCRKYFLYNFAVFGSETLRLTNDSPPWKTFAVLKVSYVFSCYCLCFYLFVYYYSFNIHFEHWFCAEPLQQWWQWFGPTETATDRRHERKPRSFGQSDEGECAGESEEGPQIHTHFYLNIHAKTHNRILALKYVHTQIFIRGHSSSVVL